MPAKFNMLEFPVQVGDRLAELVTSGATVYHAIALGGLLLLLVLTIRPPKR